MTAPESRQPKTVVIHCATCGARLAEAIAGSVARCSRCGTWSGTTIRTAIDANTEGAMTDGKS